MLNIPHLLRHLESAVSWLLMIRTTQFYVVLVGGFSPTPSEKSMRSRQIGNHFRKV